MAADQASSAAAILSSVLDNFKNLPATSPARSSSSHFRPSSGPRFDSGRLFGRQRPVHDLLGGGHSADVLLWRKNFFSAGFLAVATAIWVLFEWIGYHFVSVVSFFLLAIIVSLFAWSYGASVLNRDPPPVPKLELSDEAVLRLAKAANTEINKMLHIVHEISIGKDPVRFVKLAGALGLLVLFGSWFQFLTLCYLAIVAAHTLPVLYEKNEYVIDRYAQRALDEVNNQFRKVDTSVLNKIPRCPAVQKRED
ncbi:hypothetical protein L7F22_024522 [Adiantum nelumboides]|nr:hypothetical protein [Adiantum nelumboides]